MVGVLYCGQIVTGMVSGRVYNVNYSNNLLIPLLFHLFLSAGCLVFLTHCVQRFVRVVEEWLNFALSLLLLSYSALRWTVTVHNHLLGHLFHSFIPS